MVRTSTTQSKSMTRGAANDPSTWGGGSSKTELALTRLPRLAHLFQANVRRGNMKNIDCKPLRPSVLTITHSAHRAKTDGSNWPISPFLPFCAWLLPVEADNSANRRWHIGTQRAFPGSRSRFVRLAMLRRSTHPPAIPFQFPARCSAVRHASACAVSVGLCAPLVPITDAPKMPRFGTS
jgi:hypothetical protein